MLRRRDGELLSVAFDALFVSQGVAWLQGHYKEREEPRYVKDVPSIIADALTALRISHNKAGHDKVFERREHFDRYADIELLREVADRMEWKTWEKDLEQWLANGDAVRDYFSALNSCALGRINHGCF